MSSHPENESHRQRLVRLLLRSAKTDHSMQYRAMNRIPQNVCFDIRESFPALRPVIYARQEALVLCVFLFELVNDRFRKRASQTKHDREGCVLGMPMRKISYVEFFLHHCFVEPSVAPLMLYSQYANGAALRFTDGLVSFSPTPPSRQPSSSHRNPASQFLPAQGFLPAHTNHQAGQLTFAAVEASSSSHTE